MTQNNETPGQCNQDPVHHVVDYTKLSHNNLFSSSDSWDISTDVIIHILALGVQLEYR